MSSLFTIADCLSAKSTSSTSLSESLQTPGYGRFGAAKRDVITTGFSRKQIDWQVIDRQVIDRQVIDRKESDPCWSNGEFHVYTASESVGQPTILEQGGWNMEAPPR